MKKKVSLLMVILFGILQTLSAQVYDPPGISWQRSYWPSQDNCTTPPVELNKITSGEDWFYGFCKSYYNGQPDGIVSVGYSSMDYFSEGSSCVSCSTSYANNTPSYGDFESATSFATRKGCTWVAKIVKTDLNGKEIWQKDYSNYFSELLNVIQSSDGYYYAIGRTHDWGSNIIYNKGSGQMNLINNNYNGYTPGGNSSTRRHMYILKLDNSGNEVWGYIYGDKESDATEAYVLRSFGFDIVESSPGQFIAVGWAEKQYTPNRKVHPFAIEINSSGTLLWKKTYDAYEGTLKKIAKREYTSGGSTIREYSVVGYKNGVDAVLPAPTDAIMFKIDNTNHNALNVTTINHDTGMQTIAFDAVYRSNGELLVGLVKDCDDCSGAAGTAEGTVYRYNTSVTDPSPFSQVGSTISIGTIKANDLKIGVCNTSDNGFAVVSTKQASRIPDDSEPYCSNCDNGKYDKEYWNSDAYVAKYSSASTPVLEWEKSFDHISPIASNHPGDVKREECVYHILQLDNGDYVICGNTSENFDDDYLVKLYSDCGVKTNYTVSNPSTNEIRIDANISWNTSKSVLGLVIVESGNTLTITGSSTVIQFADSKRTGIKTGILVEAGAKLEVLDGAKLTVYSGCSGSMWDGITLYGNKNDVQSVLIQGVVYMRDNATIEYARAAIITGRREDAYSDYTNHYSKGNSGFTGGIIDVEYSNFKDNFQSIVINPYSYGNSPFYYSNISNCTFTNTGLMRDQEYVDNMGRRLAQKDFISFSSIKKLIVNDNFFQGSTTVPAEFRGVGINAFNANLSAQGNEFSDLTYGIYGSSITSLFGRTHINSNTFSNVRKGIKCQTTVYDEISFNTFNIPGYEFNILYPTVPSQKGETWGLKLENSNSFDVNGNIFQSTEDFDLNSAWGSIVNNSASRGGIVENNAYSDIAYGTQTERNNPNLDIKCNTYTNHFNAWSINPQSNTGVLKNQGEGIEPTEKQAGNLFDNVCTISNQEINSTVEFTYFASSDGVVLCASNIVNVIPAENTREATCSGGLFACGNSFIECYEDWLLEIENETDEIKKTAMINHYVRMALQNDMEDEAITYLENILETFSPDNNAIKRQLIASYYVNSDFTSASDMLTSYEVIDENDNDFVNLMEILITADSVLVDIFYLSEDEMEQIEDISGNATEAAYMAKAILRELKGTDFDDAPELWDLEPQSRPVQSNVNELTSLLEEENKIEKESTLSAQRFNIYPNPANASITIEGVNGVVSICDALGRQLANYNKNQNLYSIDTQQLANGVYLLKLIAETGEVNTKKIIINR